jgi:hypothetical protein
MSDEKAQPNSQPAQAAPDDKPAAPPSAPDGQPGYKPPALDPQLWHWVEKREAPPGEATDHK